VNLDRLRWPKASSSYSYVDCPPKTNVAILLDMGHTKGSLYKSGMGQGKETKNVNEDNMFTEQE
jgi:hypothetical protein